MSSSSTPRIFSFKAAAAQAAYTFVKPGADAQHVGIASASSDKLVGIAMSAPTAAEDDIEVALPGAGAKLKLGGSVSFGDILTADASGFGVATTSNAARAGAMAMADGVANDIIPVEVLAGII
jgi:hypothetical protein